MIEILDVAIYICVCFIIAKAGENRKIGFTWSYIFSFFLTPIIGGIITLLNPKVNNNNATNKIINIIGASLFVVVMHILFAIFSYNYTEWIMQKDVLWIILITITTIEIVRRILNKTPFLLGNLNGSADTILTVVAIFDKISKILFLIVNIKMLDIHDTNSIISRIFCFLIFYGLVNFLNYGLCLKCEKY
jgi:hypothetical protein